MSAGPRWRASVGEWRQQRQRADGGSSDDQRVAAAAALASGCAAAAGRPVPAATLAAELACATGRGPRRQRSGRSDGGDKLVPACGSGLVGPTDFFCFFVFGKCLPSASFNTRQNFYRVREEKHSAKVPFADVCLPCIVCREQHTANILPGENSLCRVPLAHGKRPVSGSGRGFAAFRHACQLGRWKKFRN